MLILSALFLYSFLIILLVVKSNNQSSAPIQCYITGGDDFIVATGFQPWGMDPVYAISRISIFLVLIYGYFTRISAAYEIRTSGMTGSDFYLMILKYNLSRSMGCSPKALKTITFIEWKKILDETVHDNRSETHIHYLESSHLN
jgi:hypothetical protein